MVSLWLALVLGAAVSRADVPADAVWIDVRTPSEYARGHLPQARLIPFDGIEAGVAGLELSLEAPIYLYCAVGGRAEAAKQRLKAQGYSNVTNAGSLESARQMAGEAQR
jgi:phage shock protein E